jgi:hypothetical protein
LNFREKGHGEEEGMESRYGLAKPSINQRMEEDEGGKTYGIRATRVQRRS